MRFLWLVVVPAFRLRARRRLGRIRRGETTVVTVNWNSSRHLATLLRLVRERSPESLRILVVDNASRDGSREVAGRTPGVRFVRLPFNAGHDVALEIGFLLVDTEFAVALDVDAFPLDATWLGALLGPLDAGAAIAGARLNRDYVHPCCLAMRTARFVGRGHSFRAHYRPRAGDADASGEVAEEMSARESGRLHFLDVTSQRGPGDLGTVFGGVVYHNFYATRFQERPDEPLDEVVRRGEAEQAWDEALARYAG